MDDISLIEELVSIPSPSGREDALAQHLVGRMSALGFRSYRDEVGNAIGVVGDPGAQRDIVLVGHMDTVPGFIPVERRDGLLYGRGSVDAKGPLGAFIMAAARVAPVLSSIRIVVVATVQEEGDGSGAKHVALTMPSPYCCIIGEPSGWEGVTLGYKGMLGVGYWTTQPGGHSAGPYPTSAEKAVAFWNSLKSYEGAHNAGVRGRFHALDASLQGFQTFGDGLEDGAFMDIGIRLPPGFQVESLKRRLQIWGGNARIILESIYPPYVAEKNTPLIRALLKAIRAEGGKPRFKLKTGTSDMNTLGTAWGCPIAVYGPGDSTLDHTPDEHLEIEELRRGVDVLARTIEVLGSGLPATVPRGR